MKRSTSLRLSSPRCPYSQSQRQPGCRCYCIAGNRLWQDMPKPPATARERGAGEDERKAAPKGDDGNAVTISSVRKMRGRHVIGHGLSTMMARKSFTLVKVGPGTSRSPGPREAGGIVVGKKGGGIEAAASPSAVSPSTSAPAALADPLPPSPVLSPASAAIAGMLPEFDRKRQGIFLIGSAAALAPDRHGQLPAGRDDRAFPAPAARARGAREATATSRASASTRSAKRNAMVTRDRTAASTAAHRVGRPARPVLVGCRGKPSTTWAFHFFTVI